jgi:hypothetical protein
LKTKPLEKTEGDRNFRMTMEDPKLKFGEHIPAFFGRDNLGYTPTITLNTPLEPYDHWDRNLSKLNDQFHHMKELIL